MNFNDESRLSKNGRNAYIIVSSENIPKNICDPEYNKNYLSYTPIERPRSCSPALLLAQTIKTSEKNKDNTNSDVLNKQTVTEKTKTTMRSEIENKQQKQISANLNIVNSANAAKINTGAVPKVQNIKSLNKSNVSTGILRYMTINKRNLSPEKTQSSLKKQKTVGSALNNNNRFDILSENDNEQTDSEQPKKFKPPPIFLRESSPTLLVKKLIEIIGKNNFHIIPLRKGGVEETKIVIYTEDDYRKVSKYLNNNNKNFYSYQLKSTKGLVVVVKGIEHSVDPNEIKEALVENGYKIKQVMNIFNRNKIPQPLFKVELEANDIKLKSNQTHPIYSLRYLLNRRITVEEPYKRNNPIQCSNCQEFGHTRNYCALRKVCVACGDLHSSAECNVLKNGLKKKCGNCGGDHSANYRGCPVYKALLKRLREKQNQARGAIAEQQFVFDEHAFKAIDTSKPVDNIKDNIRLVEQNIKPQEDNRKFLIKSGTPSYASILKTGQQQPIVNQNVGLETMLHTLTQNITALNQNICNFMTSMQSNIQELIKAQNQMIQIILTKK